VTSLPLVTAASSISYPRTLMLSSSAFDTSPPKSGYNSENPLRKRRGWRVVTPPCKAIYLYFSVSKGFILLDVGSCAIHNKRTFVDRSRIYTLHWFLQIVCAGHISDGLELQSSSQGVEWTIAPNTTYTIILGSLLATLKRQSWPEEELVSGKFNKQTMVRKASCKRMARSHQPGIWAEKGSKARTRVNLAQMRSCLRLWTNRQR
jgi:hypothetical protein